MADQPTRPQPGVVPDSAMDSGSDEGTPGEHLADPALEPDEAELLRQLQRQEAESPESDLTPIEASPEAEAAVEDDSPLPSPPQTPQRDQLSPTFREPTPPKQ